MAKEKEGREGYREEGRMGKEREGSGREGKKGRGGKLGCPRRPTRN